MKELWFLSGNGVSNHWSTPVCKDGYLMASLVSKTLGHCPLKCVELATGKVMGPRTASARAARF